MGPLSLKVGPAATQTAPPPCVHRAPPDHPGAPTSAEASGPRLLTEAAASYILDSGTASLFPLRPASPPRRDSRALVRYSTETEGSHEKECATTQGQH